MAVASAAAAAQRTQQLIKGERHLLFSSSDDAAVVKQILGTHSPDGREVDCRPLMRVVEDILQRATPTVVIATAIPETIRMDVVDDKLIRNSGVTGMLEALAYTIHRISCEISYKCTAGGGDAHATTLALFHTLSSYSWDSKAVLSLAAFATLYGEFWLTAQLHTVNPLARSVAVLKQLPAVLERADLLKPRFDALHALVGAAVDVTNCIIEFKELPSEYIQSDSPEMAAALAHVPIAVYWVMRAILACVSQIIGLIGLGHEYMSSTTEAWELSTLSHKLSNIHGHLTKQLALCHQHIDERKHNESYQNLVKLFDMVHIDNMKILKALFYSKDNLPLIDPTNKKRVPVDVLRRKMVVLLISDLNLSPEELFVIEQVYNETATGQGKLERPYEIVWIPVANDRHAVWTPAKEEAFSRLASAMRWYSLHHPLSLDPAVVKYIRDVWHFDKKPLLVVLDTQGKVVCPNAHHMMWIWGSLAFPFTSNREVALWKEQTWSLEFLVDEIDPSIRAWVTEGRHICLYGGENIDWIRKFTAAMRHAAFEMKVPLEMVYVGKSIAKDRLKKVTSVIAQEKLSGYWQDPTMVWFFWSRLESMWHSRSAMIRQQQEGSGKAAGAVAALASAAADDPIIQEVMAMLSFDSGDEGWALVSRGSAEIARANGKMMLECLIQLETWRANVEKEGFVPALAGALLPYHTHEHCTRLIIPGDIGRIQEHVVCTECRRPMEKFVLYRCCND